MISRTLAAALAAALLTTTPHIASAAPAPASEPSQDAGEIFIDDAELLAEELGIDEATARDWLIGEDEFLAAIDHARAAASEIFLSAAWTPENEPAAARGRVTFTGEPPAPVRERFESLGFPVEIRTDAAHGEVKLEQIRADLMEELAEAAELDGLTGDITEDGEIHFGYHLAESEDAPAEAEERIADVLASAPVETVAEPDPASVAVDEVLRGGNSVNGCTLGFAATARGGRGAISAGHCPNSAGSPAGSTAPLRFVRAHIGALGDSQFHSTTDRISNSVRVSRASSTRAITGTATPVAGATACNYGKTRAQSSCTRIRRANHAVHSKNGLIQRLVQTSGTFTNRGDSGGPWYSGGRALGVHYGKSGGYSTFTSIRAAETALGGRVFTG